MLKLLGSLTRDAVEPVSPTTSADDSWLLEIADVLSPLIVTVFAVSVGAYFVVESSWLSGLVGGRESVPSCGDEVPRISGTEGIVFAEAVVLLFPNDVAKPSGVSDLAGSRLVVITAVERSVGALNVSFSKAVVELSCSDGVVASDVRGAEGGELGTAVEVTVSSLSGFDGEFGVEGGILAAVVICCSGVAVGSSDVTYKGDMFELEVAVSVKRSFCSSVVVEACDFAADKDDSALVGATAELWRPAVMVNASCVAIVKAWVLVVVRTVEVSCPCAAEAAGTCVEGSIFVVGVTVEVSFLGIVDASDVDGVEGNVVVVGATVEVLRPGIVETSDVAGVEGRVVVVCATVEVLRSGIVEASDVAGVEGRIVVVWATVEVSRSGIVETSDVAGVEGRVVVVCATVEVSRSGIVEAPEVAGVEGKVVVVRATVEVSRPGIVETSDVTAVEGSVVVVWTAVEVSRPGGVVEVVCVVKDGAVVVSSSHRDIHCMCVLSSEVINICMPCLYELRNISLLKTIKTSGPFALSIQNNAILV